MKKANLGMGMLRLPILDGDNAKVDLQKTCEMVDAYMASGFHYYDTSYVYHGGKSEEAVRKAVTERYARDRYTITSKLPVGRVDSLEKAEEVFTQQLQNCGVDYFDYYLLHNTKGPNYDKIIQPLNLFGFIHKKKEEGKVRKIGFSFHDSPEVLDRMLNDHPEVDFVQIVLNYYDWNSCWIRSRECYEVIRKHGKDVIIMEPVKGGMLAHPPVSLLDKMQKADPSLSPSAWALRFAASFEGVIAILSGMHDLEQVIENTNLFNSIEPLNEEEKKMLIESTPDYWAMGPYGIRDFEKYRGISEVPVDCILEVSNILQYETSVGVGANADNNYYEGYRHSIGIEECRTSLITEPIIDKDGNDITEMVKEAESFLLWG